MGDYDAERARVQSAARGRRHSPPTLDDVRREAASRRLRRLYGVVCLSCRGSGIRDDRHCAACDGVGRVP